MPSPASRSSFINTTSCHDQQRLFSASTIGRFALLPRIAPRSATAATQRRSYDAAAKRVGWRGASHSSQPAHSLPCQTNGGYANAKALCDAHSGIDCKLQPSKLYWRPPTISSINGEPAPLSASSPHVLSVDGRLTFRSYFQAVVAASMTRAAAAVCGVCL